MQTALTFHGYQIQDGGLDTKMDTRSPRIFLHS